MAWSLEKVIWSVDRANYHFHGKPFLSVFTHLAISLVFELGLHKPVQAPPPIFNLNSCPIASGIRTMEEHRAALGFFMIISVYATSPRHGNIWNWPHSNSLSSIVQEIEPFRWTPRMEESLQTLEKENECPNDEILVHLVRMQLVLEQSKSERSSINELSEGRLGLFSDVKAKLFDSSPKDGEYFSIIYPIVNSWY